jgi:hypothetical protein
VASRWTRHGTRYDSGIDWPGSACSRQHAERWRPADNLYARGMQPLERVLTQRFERSPFVVSGVREVEQRSELLQCSVRRTRFWRRLAFGGASASLVDLAAYECWNRATRQGRPKASEATCGFSLTVDEQTTGTEAVERQMTCYGRLEGLHRRVPHLRFVADQALHNCHVSEHRTRDTVTRQLRCAIDGIRSGSKGAAQIAYRRSDPREQR